MVRARVACARVSSGSRFFSQVLLPLTLDHSVFGDGSKVCATRLVNFASSGLADVSKTKRQPSQFAHFCSGFISSLWFGLCFEFRSLNPALKNQTWARLQRIERNNEIKSVDIVKNIWQFLLLDSGLLQGGYGRFSSRNETHTQGVENRMYRFGELTQILATICQKKVEHFFILSASI